MTRAEFAEMVDYVTDRFGMGAMGSWEAAAKVAADFELFDAELVWETLLAKLDSDPKASFPPPPPALRAAVLDRWRPRQARKALPETTETYTWAEFSKRKYGEVISLREAVERAAEGVGGVV